MRAVAWHGKRDVRVDNVPEPTIRRPTDIIVKITTTGLCGSDLHLYEVLGAFLDEGDVLGHEPMGIVEEVGGEVAYSARATGWLSRSTSRVAPASCVTRLHSQCATTQVREQGMGASLFGYTKLYGQVPGVARRSTCGCRSGTRCRSRFRTAHLTSASSTSPMCCRPLGRPCSMPTSRPVAAWP